MKMFDKNGINCWVYEKCKIKDEEKYWRLINNSIWCYLYCRDVKDREEVWKKN